MNWYYEAKGEQRGPVSEEDLLQLVSAGQVRAETLVWREGWPEWRPWGAVAGVSVPAGGATPPPTAPGSLASPEPEAGGRKALPILFSGSGGEYFRVWIVNVLLTVVTLGIYAAWAKVRTRRYFYANTSLAGHAFEYLADPKRILIGNLIVIGAFILLNIAGAISPLLQLPLFLAIGVAVPWVIVRSMLFNARNSAWRGLRFGFSGTYGEALVVFVLLPLLVPFTLGLIWPYVVQRRREWMTRGHRFGTTPFGFDGQAGDVYLIYLKALGFFLAPMFAFFVVMIASAGAAFSAANPEGEAAAGAAMLGLSFALPFALFGGALSFFAGTCFLRARIFSFAWNHTHIGPHRLSAAMRARDLMGLQIVNLLVTVLTLGLAWPWVAVRTARFQLSRLSVLPGGSLDDFVGASQPEPGALSEAAGDFLDFDIGFGL
jgi:uncharacterized membrane protein YjgN (DUF898 family)